MEVGLGLGDTALDEDPAPLSTQRGTAATTFWPTTPARIPAGSHFTHNLFC